jgi:hypothetical protein
MMHSHNKVRDGITMEEIVALRKANPGGGPHSMTGPIFVNGAEPGDVMEIRILKIVPKNFGISFNLPGTEFPTIGALASEMPEGFVKFFHIDPNKKSVEFKPGRQRRPAAVPRDARRGHRPERSQPAQGRREGRPHGAGLDAASVEERLQHGRERAAGRLDALHSGVPQGRLIWMGDSHCRQGNGEVSLTALECSYKEIRIQPIVRKDMKIDWPRGETQTHWIFMGFDEDLNKAMVNATREAVNWLAEQKMVPMSTLRGLLARLDGGRLPRVAGGGRAQGRALHDPEGDLHAKK